MFGKRHHGRRFLSDELADGVQQHRRLLLEHRLHGYAVRFLLCDDSGDLRRHARMHVDARSHGYGRNRERELRVLPDELQQRGCVRLRLPVCHPLSDVYGRLRHPVLHGRGLQRNDGVRRAHAVLRLCPGSDVRVDRLERSLLDFPLATDDRLTAWRGLR